MDRRSGSGSLCGHGKERGYKGHGVTGGVVAGHVGKGRENFEVICNYCHKQDHMKYACPENACISKLQQVQSLDQCILHQCKMTQVMRHTRYSTVLTILGI